MDRPAHPAPLFGRHRWTYSPMKKAWTGPFSLKQEHLRCRTSEFGLVFNRLLCNFRLNGLNGSTGLNGSKGLNRLTSLNRLTGLNKFTWFNGLTGLMA